MKPVLVLLAVVAVAKAQYGNTFSASNSFGSASGGFSNSASFSGVGRPAGVGAFGRPTTNFGSGSGVPASYGSGGSFGSGGPIVFPTDTAPSHNLPIRPNRPVRPVRPVQPNIPFVSQPSNPFPVQPSNPFPVQPSNPFPVQPVNPFPAQPSNPYAGNPFLTQPNNPNPVQPNRPITLRPATHLNLNSPPCSVDLVDHQAFGSKYHFSWCHDGFQNYTQPSAINYCSSLGSGWQGVSIENQAEDQLISSIVGGHRLDWIWTGGVKHGRNEFYWPSGKRFNYNNWSFTGFNGTPQPDNREDNNEQCLAILNNFYNDGIVWHDIGCHHEKPIICENALH